LVFYFYGLVVGDLLG